MTADTRLSYMSHNSYRHNCNRPLHSALGSTNMGWYFHYDNLIHQACNEINCKMCWWVKNNCNLGNCMRMRHIWLLSNSSHSNSQCMPLKWRASLLSNIVCPYTKITCYIIFSLNHALFRNIRWLNQYQHPILLLL